MLALLAATLLAAEPRTGEFPNETLKVGGASRQYRLVAPAALANRKPAPLLVAFHGMGIDSKDLMPLYTKFGALAAQHGFLLAFPNAIGRSWGLAPEKIKNDLALFDALVAKLSGEYPVDPQRVYVVGMSNGGYFAHLVAKERSTKVAAAASHSGPLGLQTLLGVQAARKFPVMIVHGVDDKLFPVAFAQENRDKYRKEGHEVKYLEVKGGHLWAPNASAEIWAFLSAHTLADRGAKQGAGS